MTNNDIIHKFIRIAKECDFYVSLKKYLIDKRGKKKLQPNSNFDLLQPYIEKHFNNILYICQNDPYNKLSMNQYEVDVTYKYCEIEKSENIILFILCSRILIEIGCYKLNEKIKMCYNYIFNG